jgi:hypothetical protein
MEKLKAVTVRYHFHNTSTLRIAQQTSTRLANDPAFACLFAAFPPPPRHASLKSPPADTAFLPLTRLNEHDTADTYIPPINHDAISDILLWLLRLLRSGLLRDW